MLKKIFENINTVDGSIQIDGRSYSNVIIGNVEEISEEYLIFQELSQHAIAPRARDIFYVKNRITLKGGVQHCDPRGCYGFFLDNPGFFVKGKFSVNSFEKTNGIEWNGAAIEMLRDPSNIKKGYLLNIRKNGVILLRYRNRAGVSELASRIVYAEDRQKLIQKIKMLSQFPHKDRKQNYQAYYLNGEYIEGTRQTLYRYDTMGISKDLSGLSVVDLGCNLGAMCCEAYLRGARNITGVDYESDYVECARDLARQNGFDINYQRMNLIQIRECADYFNGYYEKPVDIVFALSLYKHIKDAQWKLLESIPWRVCYLESHNSPEGLETGHVREMSAFLSSQNAWEVNFLGQTSDRSPRCVWRLENKKYAAQEAALKG